MNRRRFLKAAALAPVVISSRALGADDAAPASERITVGMIGMGRQTHHVNLRQLLGMPDVQVVAVCDVDSWRLKNAKQRVQEQYSASAGETYRGCEATVAYEDVLARDDVDAVMIATPDHWHAPMALAAMRAGKDVSLEKPITRTIAEGRQLARVAKRRGRIFRVDSEFRSQKCVHRAAELVRNGRIGEVHTVMAGVPESDVGCPPQPEMPVPEGLDYERWQGPAPRAPYTERRVHKPEAYDRPGWMRHLYYCDGMITNWGTHLNDGAMWATGLERTGPVSIEATGEYPPGDSFWNVLLRFSVEYEFAEGVRWVYRTEKPYFKIEGSEGWVWADFSELRAEPESLLSEEIGDDEIRFPLRSDKRDFIDAVKSRTETLEPAEVGHRVTSLCHLGHIAIQMGEKLTWNPRRERFVDNAAANRLISTPIHTPSHP